MRDLAEALILSHLLTLAAIASAALGLWEMLLFAVPAICCAVFLTYVATIDAAREL